MKQKIGKIQKFIYAYCKNVENGLNERWRKIPVNLYHSEIYEAIGCLLARQATLTIYLAMSPTIWNGHIAPLILRCMTDAHITLAWILIEPHIRARKYILYGLGQEKLQIEHLIAKNEEEHNERIEQMIEVKRIWLNSQRIDYLTEVDVGNWAGLNTREMAKEANCEGLYNFAYTPFSGASHNMWQHVSIYNAKQCANPMHKYHLVPDIIELGSDIDYVYRSAKYVTRSYIEIDKKYDLKIKETLPLNFFKDEYDKFNE